MSKRISGVELQDNWRVGYALTRIKGISWSSSDKIISGVGIDSAKRIADLGPDEVAKIASKLEEFTTEGDLIREVRQNIQRLIQIEAYRGSRHRKGLPARGQRTRSNARTKRGKRKTVGAFKKEQLSKMKQQDKKEGSK